MAYAATAIQTAIRGFLVRRTIDRAKNYLEHQMSMQGRGVPLRLLPYLRRDLRWWHSDWLYDYLQACRKSELLPCCTPYGTPRSNTTSPPRIA